MACTNESHVSPANSVILISVECPPMSYERGYALQAYSGTKKTSPSVFEPSWYLKIPKSEPRQYLNLPSF